MADTNKGLQFGFENGTWNRYDLENIVKRVEALENASGTGGNQFQGIFPVGTVLAFASKNIDETQLAEMYGGKWLLYGKGRTLVGATSRSKANVLWDAEGGRYQGNEIYDNNYAGTMPSDQPQTNDWYVKMTTDKMPAHSHTGSESGDGHWHNAWSTQSYNNEQGPTGGTKAEKHSIYMDWNGSSGNKTYKALLQIPTVEKNYTNMYPGNVLKTDYPVSFNSSNQEVQGPVKITTNVVGTKNARIGTWQPYITVCFYKRVE